MAIGYRPEIIQRAFVDFVGSHLHPFWSLTRPKLRLITRQVINDDLIALQFEGNYAFNRQVFDRQLGWHGGQYIGLTVIIDGIHHQRHYSLVGLPKQPLYLYAGIDNTKNKQSHIITIAIKPQGLVSNYLTQQAKLGTIFDSGLPSGEFTLTQSKINVQSKTNTQRAKHQQTLPTSSSLLFIAGGSGITPMVGLITQALEQTHQNRIVTLLYYSRIPLAETPFLEHWRQLKERYPNFNYHFINTEDPNSYLASTRYLSSDSLLALNLPLAETQIFACGSQALLAGLYEAAAEITLPTNKQLRDNIIVESFGNALVGFNMDGYQTFDKTVSVEEHTVYLRSRHRQFSSDTTILIAAEKADVRLAHGCRQGICQLCRCNKVSGVVQNIQTGKISHEGYESIQTCINIAMTDVVLDI
ncbi:MULTISPECIES: flavin reductase family protein [unclassified Psychrobacter]|uniref:flavin reductase family protein n=2 Tax=Psychrobacter TaxID=497 RepID=UPI001787EE00|nr:MULTISPECIES: iron-sulfur cluster-binding domain-containing protein [unclassified Psychrobacter]MBE0442373.1 iron-sulfur cluster-binding domain-containing protein [Psychrobacter sp. FME13]